MKFLNFLQYNNAVPIAISVLILGAGSTFAATNPDAIYSESQATLSIDNTYIASKDLANYSPQAQIVGVTEDSENYYVAYRFFTIDLENGVWQDVAKDRTMTVSKEFLGAYRDLGVYVTEQLKENVDADIVRLKNTQEIEIKNVTQKVVATAYGGLIGKMLDTTTETLPGYTPVVAPQSQVASADGSQNSGGNNAGESNSTAQIGLQLLGNNPAVIPLHTSYSDLGAVLIDPNHQNVGIHVFQNGIEVSAATVDTSTTSVATIEYRATDHSGTTVMVRRVVLIGGAADPGGAISSAGNTTITNPQPAQTTPAPASSTPGDTPSTSSPATTTSATTTPETTTNATTTETTLENHDPAADSAEGTGTASSASTTPSSGATSTAAVE